MTNDRADHLALMIYRQFENGNRKDAAAELARQPIKVALYLGRLMHKKGCPMVDFATLATLLDLLAPDGD